MMPSFRKSRSAAAVSTPTSSWPSRVEAAMCGRGDDLRQHLQPVIDRRLLLEDVERGAADLARLDRVGERGLVDEIAARGVDDADAFACARASRSALTRLARLRRRRHVQRHVVGAREQVVERDELHAEVGRDLLGDERIVGDDPHAERRGAARDFLADAAQAGEAERLVAHFFAEELLLLPLALLHRGVGRGKVAGERQHERHREFGDADAVGAGRVHDDDAAGAGGGDVHVVDAGAGARDDPQLGCGVDQRAR